MRRGLISVACLVALTVSAASIAAGDMATLVLRSGVRVTGDLLDMGGVDITIAVGGDVRHYPIAETAVIDFVGGGQGLPDTEIAAVPEGRHVAFLRAPGTPTIVGRLYDISGTSPLRFTFQTPDGERVVTSSQIGRVYLARPPRETQAAVAPPPERAQSEAPPPGAITVAANRQWTPTGLVVRQGERISFATTGRITLSTDAADVAGPAGALNQRLAAGAPLPQSLAGALIGRIGSGAPFGIGDQTSVPMPGSGALFLGINDDEVSDNAGQFYVVIARPPQRRR